MADLDPAEVVRGTADAAFVVDADGVIVAWNATAEELLGITAHQAVGKPCHQILCGLDPFGNRYCGEHCAVALMTDRREPVRQFALEVCRGSRDRIAVSVSIVVLPDSGASRPLTLHLLTPLAAVATAFERAPLTTLSAAGPRAPGASTVAERLPALTSRELQVLRLLATGHASQDVANELSISLTTVRTHIQNILRKLETHSQLEAVAAAYRRGLI